MRNEGRKDNMKIEVSKDSIIGDVIKNVPGADEVIEKFFGNGCFTCPGINMESIAFGAAMHNMAPETIVSEIKKLAEKDNGT